MQRPPKRRGRVGAKKRPTRYRPTEDEQRGKVVGKAYAVTSFPLREGQSWREARLAAEIDPMRPWLTPAARWPGGLIIGYEADMGLIEDLMDAFAAFPATDLYTEHYSEAKNEGSITSEREEADGRLVVLASQAFEDIVDHFIDLALAGAIRAAMIIALDVAAQHAANPEGSAYLRRMPAVRRFEQPERTALVDDFSTKMRRLISSVLLDSDDVVRRVGRRAEEDRDHRAFCMRARLVDSPNSEYAATSKHERYRLAKARVLEEVVGPGCSERNWYRIMSSGRAVHARVSPNTPFCED